MSWWTALVLGVGAVAAYWDLRWRKIPRQLTVPAFAAGLLYHALAGGFVSAALAAASGLALGLLLVQLGAVGGGDAKLLTALGAMLGFPLWCWSVEFGVLVAAMVALTQLALRKRLVFLAGDLGAIVRGWRQHGLRPHPDHNVNAPGAVTAPFGVSLGIGLLLALLLV